MGVVPNETLMNHSAPGRFGNMSVLHIARGATGPRRFHQALASAIVLAAVAGCAAAGSFPDEAGDPRTPGRRCEVAELPVLLPSAAALVDSVALARDLRALQLARDTVEGEALLSMAYDDTGLNIRRKLARHTLPRVVADSLQQLVFVHRKTVEPGREWGAQLEIGLGDEIRMEVKRQTLCSPELRSTQGTPTRNTIEVPRRAGIVQGPRRTVRVRVLVGENGLVQRAEIDRGVMESRLETQLIGYVYSFTFQPGLEDGVPVTAWTTVTIRGLVY